MNKYRAWDKEGGFMMPVRSIDFERELINKDGAWRMFNEIILMQSTGLKDKNGVEIFSNDILLVLNNKTNQKEIGVVIMSDLGCWSIKIENLKVPLFEFIDNRLSLVHSTERVEIIGNIYENLELLKEVE